MDVYYMKIKKMRLFTLSALLVACVGTNVFAATKGFQSYSDYLVGNFKQNTYSNLHTKETKNMYIINEVTNDHDSWSKLTFWVANNKDKQISSDYEFKEGDQKYMYHNDASAVKFGLENKTWTPFWGIVSGKCDFR